jgi:mono/diheme cytochrome c family protein
MVRSTASSPLIGILLTAATASLFTGCGEGDAPLPEAPEVITAAKPPPAISGGTLIVGSDGKTAIAADSDRDRVWAVDLESNSLVADIALQPDDEPGRLVQDAAGRVHVALRRGGAVATIDLDSQQVLRRTDVCPMPRGIAYDSQTDLLHVACSGGELISIAASTGATVRTLRLERDLRDVVVDGDRLLVSRFRSPALKVLDANGTEFSQVQPKTLASVVSFGQEFEPRVAWRTVAIPGGGAVMLHQRSLVTGENTPLTIAPQGYYHHISGSTVVHDTVSVIRPIHDSTTQPYATPRIGGSISKAAFSSGFGGTSLDATVLAVDVAVSSTGRVAVASAGNDLVFVSTLDGFDQDSAAQFGEFNDARPISDGQPVAVAFSGKDQIIVQSREPAAIINLDTGARIDLPGESARDTGHDIFHRNTGGVSPVACASCHPEGGDDAKVWNVAPIGPRRTQVLRGKLSETFPLHWDGQMKSMDNIMQEVFVKRMGGQPQGPRKVEAMERWLDTQPAAAPSPTGTEEQIGRGAALFFDATTACASCHSGSHLTNNTSVDVGRGKVQVPALLGVAARAPYMHDGCAPTLRDRFTNLSCGGGDSHGKTSQLSSEQIDDLVAYLETL